MYETCVTSISNDKSLMLLKKTSEKLPSAKYHVSKKILVSCYKRTVNSMHTIFNTECPVVTLNDIHQKRFRCNPRYEQ